MCVPFSVRVCMVHTIISLDILHCHFKAYQSIINVDHVRSHIPKLLNC